ncbi:MAG: SufD family Fe-S cluster assembly protein [Acidimicrobiales bacterium]
MKQYFGIVIPANDNKFGALNTAVWSGGSFIYVPPGVKVVDMPLQASTSASTPRTWAGVRAHADHRRRGLRRALHRGMPGTHLHGSDLLHSAVVEIVVKPSARVTYTTIQNWSSNVFNLVTKRARVEAEGHMEWIDGNIGSRLIIGTRPCGSWAPRRRARCCRRPTGEGQHQDTGSKMVHAAPETTSNVSKSISKDGGRTSYRGPVRRVEDGAYGCKSHVQCDALILDDESVSDTYPYMEVGARDAVIGHDHRGGPCGRRAALLPDYCGLLRGPRRRWWSTASSSRSPRPCPWSTPWSGPAPIELQMEGSVG